ncbi:MAG TPA: adenylosuccinate lyase, partial [Candidatus Nanoarchaeia archaeon]|nr:adenylosuccinate lyase [Candidatus Nanoarchaeia archaeon]
MNPPSLPDILATRYATPELQAIFSEEGKIILERELWITVMKAQQTLGLHIPSEAITAYEQAIHNIDLTRIKERERVKRHDVDARIDEFNHVAGHTFVHQGMT